MPAKWYFHLKAYLNLRRMQLFQLSWMMCQWYGLRLIWIISLF